MCGISALFSVGGQELAHSILGMNDQIRHRGPDDEGVVLFGRECTPLVFGGEDTPEELLGSSYPYHPSRQLSRAESCCRSQSSFKVALGHRRLSIIDQSVLGHQPLCSQDQSLWITYNGEVYNYIEIRRELVEKGYRFFSKTDTEVVLAAYQEWGVDCLNRFNGMFAFVIYDSREETFFAARDRFGIKPLYFWRSPSGVLAFGSEIKQFTALDGWRAEAHPQAVFDYLYYGLTDHSSETLFNGVYQLKGGEFIYEECRSLEREITPRRWYTPNLERSPKDFHSVSREFLELLEDSVRLRLRSDVPVGSCLSGGLDSSSIVCLMDRILKEGHRGYRQHTFSSCSTEKEFDEKLYADEVVAATDVEPCYLYPNLSDLFDQLNTIIWHQDQPFGSTSIFAQWEVFKSVKSRSVKVMLDGQGADELLGGYTPFLYRRLYDLLRTGRVSSCLREFRESSKLHGVGAIDFLPRAANYAFPRVFRNRLKRALGRSADRVGWIDLNAFPAGSIDFRDPFHFRSGLRSSVNQLSALQLKELNLPMLLRYEDRDSMAHSIEARTPFLDYRLVEFVLSLPSSFKVKDGVTKRLLREGMKGILPEKIRNRMGKLGFATPEEVWICRERPKLFLSYVEEAIERSGGILTGEAYQQAERIVRGEIPFSFFIWRVICFGQWMKVFRVGERSTCFQSPQFSVIE